MFALKVKIWRRSKGPTAPADGNKLVSLLASIGGDS
jgi:hypothetical protein